MTASWLRVNPPTFLKLPPTTSQLPSGETSSSITYGAYASRDSLIGRSKELSIAPVSGSMAASPRTVLLLTLPNSPPRISRSPTSAKSLTVVPALALKLVSSVPSRCSFAIRWAGWPSMVVNAPATRIPWPSAV